MAIVKAISNSPGNFWFSNISSYSYFLRAVPGIDFHIKINIRIQQDRRYSDPKARNG